MKNPKLIASFAIGCALVLLALVTSDFGERQMVENTTAVRIAKAPERERIEVVDTDKNGIPDWQEQIVPENTPTLNITTGDDYTKPDTLTGQASVEFFKQFMDMKSGNSLAISEEQFIEQFASNVVRSSEDSYIRSSDVRTVSQTDAEFLRQYVNAVAEIFISEGFIEKAGDELDILTASVEQNNPDLLSGLEPIASSLTRSISRAQELPVPSSLLQEHINIVNGAISIRNDILGMGRIYEDPMYAFVRLRRYDQDTVNITQAFFNIEDRAVQLGARFEANDPINFQ